MGKDILLERKSKAIHLHSRGDEREEMGRDHLHYTPPPPKKKKTLSKINYGQDNINIRVHKQNPNAKYDLYQI